jgi:hypothetical protein
VAVVFDVGAPLYRYFAVSAHLSEQEKQLDYNNHADNHQVGPTSSNFHSEWISIAKQSHLDQHCHSTNLIEYLQVVDQLHVEWPSVYQIQGHAHREH